MLDLACGTGDFCRELTKRGLQYLSASTSRGACWPQHAPTRRCVQGDALALPVRDASIDGVTCGFALRNFVELDPFFAELARALRPDGRIALLEVAEPRNPSCAPATACISGSVVPVIGQLLSDGAAYRYLPKSVAYLPPEAECCS